MLYTTAKNIDMSKYKRFFTFGCSFTGYKWESWADILAMENPQIEFVNGGRCGAGQIFIMAQLSQYIRKYNIGEGDLVGIMWSTFFREDKYVETHDRAWDNWITPGNIYSQGEYPMSYVNEFTSPRGLYIRDMAIIDTTTQMLGGAEFDSFAMLGVSLEDQNMYTGIADEDADNFDDIIALYSDLNSKILPDLYRTEFNSSWGAGYTYVTGEGENCHIHEDYHPDVLRYAAYLEKIGFTLSPLTKDILAIKHEKYKNVKYEKEFESIFHFSYKGSVL